MGLLTLGTTFDLQAHRGGAGLWPENSLEAFGHALELGVSTLECDVHVSADGVAVLSHERTFAGKLIAMHPLAELDSPATLDELVRLLDAHGADEVGLNVETKFDVCHPDEAAPRERFVEVVLASLRDADLVRRTTIQSFDWAVLRLVRAAAPDLGLNALTTTDYLEVDEPGASPWLAGIDIDDFHDSIPEAVSFLGFDAISPSHTVLTPAMVAEAHEVGLRVLPWTVDAPATMRRLIAIGVDGMITNRPDVARDVLVEMGMSLPRRYPRIA